MVIVQDTRQERAELINRYMAEYPADLVEACVELFAQKSGNVQVRALVRLFPRPYTRDHLRAVLDLCTFEEIIHVGW